MSKQIANTQMNNDRVNNEETVLLILKEYSVEKRIIASGV